MELYWLLRLPHLHDMLNATCFFSFISGIVFLVATIVSFVDDGELKSFVPYRWIFLKILSFCLLLSFVNCFVPTKTDLALMIGWDAIKSDKVHEVIEILKDKIK